MSLKLTDSAFLLRGVILFLVCLVAVAVRLFAVVRYESVIHEFDPYFNFRVSKHLTDHGFYEMHNWFDEKVWYPLGRNVGRTVYPGLMLTAGFAHHLLNTVLHLSVDIRNICVFLAPAFAALTALTTYAIGAEIATPGAGLVAAAMIAVVPGYVQRSVAGSYDNEAVAIFAMIFTYYLWVKSVRTGELLWAGLTALAYFYMVSAWGGYVFVINLIPLHAATLLLVGRFSMRLYVAYSVVYVLGTLLSMNLQNILFVPLENLEHFAALLVFALLQLWVGVLYLRSLLAAHSFRTLMVALVVVGLGAMALGTLLASYIVGYSGRLLSLLDPSGKHMAIIKSVSEHQPPVWTSFFLDIHIAVVLIPVGALVLFQRLTDGAIFFVLYAGTAVYFASVMVRLVLVLAPIACILAGVAVSHVLDVYASGLRGVCCSASETAVAAAASAPETEPKPNESTATASKAAEKSSKGATSAKASHRITACVGLVVVPSMALLLVYFMVHSSWVAQAAYSEPSIVMSSMAGRQRVIFDDFREAYYWIRQNTPEDAIIASWWDYGYQLSAMANRTTLVDNNTWNNTQIGTVGKMMVSNETVSLPLLRKYDVDYLLVLFGGMIGFSGDDAAKALWLIRIGGSVDPNIKEADYLSPSTGQFAMDDSASPTWRRSLLYKMLYYRFGEQITDPYRPAGFDRARGVVCGEKRITFRILEEAFTSEHWLVRIYRVKKDPEVAAFNDPAPGRIKSGNKKRKAEATARAAEPKPQMLLPGADAERRALVSGERVAWLSAADEAAMRKRLAARAKRSKAAKKTDAKKADAKKTDAKKTDAKKTDAKKTGGSEKATKPKTKETKETK